MANVGIGLDYNPHRLWPKNATVTFEITLHTQKRNMTLRMFDLLQSKFSFCNYFIA